MSSARINIMLGLAAFGVSPAAAHIGDPMNNPITPSAERNRAVISAKRPGSDHNPENVRFMD
jgi:hypothetical protein